MEWDGIFREGDIVSAILYYKQQIRLRKGGVNPFNPENWEQKIELATQEGDEHKFQAIWVKCPETKEYPTGGGWDGDEPVSGPCRICEGDGIKLELVSKQ